MAHGGVHATLLDTAMGGTLISMMAKEEWSATAQLDISYLNAAHPGDHLVATAEVVRRGRNLAHIEGRLVTAEGEKGGCARAVPGLSRDGVGGLQGDPTTPPWTKCDWSEEILSL